MTPISTVAKAPKPRARPKLFCFQEILGFDVDGIGEKMELRTNLDEVAADLRHLVDQQAMGRQVELVEIDPEPGAQIPLLIQVDREYHENLTLAKVDAILDRLQKS